MAHVLITFHSQTGNTERMAGAIAAGVAETGWLPGANPEKGP